MYLTPNPNADAEAYYSDMQAHQDAIALYRIYRQVNPPLRAARLALLLAGD